MYLETSINALAECAVAGMVWLLLMIKLKLMMMMIKVIFHTLIVIRTSGAEM